jgi:cholesterol transport system auxiliary component
MSPVRAPHTPPAGGLLTCVLLMGLGGCSGGLHSNAPAEQAYVLRAVTDVAVPAETVHPSPASTLRVARPLAVPGLGSDRIVVVRADHRLDAYANSRWAGPLPEVVDALAVETLRSSGRFASVEDDRAPGAADYVLRMTLRRFEAEYAAIAGDTKASVAAAPPPVLRVTLDCLVVRRGDGTIVASFTADASKPAAANRLGEAIDGFETALRTALSQVVLQTASAVAIDVQKSETPSPSTKR